MAMLMSRTRKSDGRDCQFRKPTRFELTVVPWWVVNSIHRIVQYNWSDERQSFLNSPEDENATNHIFRDLENVHAWLLAPPEKVVPAPVFWSAAAVTFGLLVFFLPELLLAFGFLDDFQGCKR